MYDLANSHIEDISRLNDKNFIPFVKSSNKSNKQITKEQKQIVYTYYYADTECDVTDQYHRAYWIRYRKRGCEQINHFEGEDCTTDFLDALLIIQLFISIILHMMLVCSVISILQIQLIKEQEQCLNHLFIVVNILHLRIHCR